MKKLFQTYQAVNKYLVLSMDKGIFPTIKTAEILGVSPSLERIQRDCQNCTVILSDILSSVEKLIILLQNMLMKALYFSLLRVQKIEINCTRDLAANETHRKPNDVIKRINLTEMDRSVYASFSFYSSRPYLD